MVAPSIKLTFINFFKTWELLLWKILIHSNFFVKPMQNESFHQFTNIFYETNTFLWFWQKSVKEHWFHENLGHSMEKCHTLFIREHTAEITEFCCHRFFAKISSNQRFTKIDLYCRLIWRKNCVAVHFSFFHILWGISPFFSSNQRFY